MRENEVTKFLVTVSGQIEYVRFPGGVFDTELYIRFECVWGPDWEIISGLPMGSTQMARSGSDPELVVFNMPVEMVFSSTNISGWPQLVLTVRANNSVSGDSLRGYALILLPPTAGAREVNSPLIRPKTATVFGEWVSWLTGRYPELVDAKMLANGKENYLLRLDSYGSVRMRLSTITKDLRKFGYDNQQS